MAEILGNDPPECNAHVRVGSSFNLHANADQFFTHLAMARPDLLFLVNASGTETLVYDSETREPLGSCHVGQGPVYNLTPGVQSHYVRPIRRSTLEDAAEVFHEKFVPLPIGPRVEALRGAAQSGVGEVTFEAGSAMRAAKDAILSYALRTCGGNQFAEARTHPELTELGETLKEGTDRYSFAANLHKRNRLVWDFMGETYVECTPRGSATLSPDDEAALAQLALLDDKEMVVGMGYKHDATTFLLPA
jgi:hypothetical protein